MMKKILLVSLTAILVVLMMPRSGMVTLDATPGQVWERPTLVAPFDVPILRSAEQIGRERERVSGAVRPVFAVDTNIVAKVKSRVVLLGLADSLPQTKIDAALVAIDSVYACGLIAHNEQKSYSNRAILLHPVGSQFLSVEHSSYFYTPQMAVDYVAAVSGFDQQKLLAFLVPNLNYDNKLTNSLRDKELLDVSTTEGLIRRGEVVVSKGQIVDRTVLSALGSVRKELESRLAGGSSIYIVFFGRLLIVMVLFLLNYLFFTRFAANYFGGGVKQLAFVMTTYLVVISMVALSVSLGVVNPYVVPLPMVAIYLLTFFNMRVAIFGNATVALISSMFVETPFEFFTISFLSGMMAIYTMRHFYHRGKLLRALGVILLTQIVVHFSFTLVQQGSFAGIDVRTYFWFLISGLLFLGFYQLIYFVERLFGFVSDITLLELCDTNQPLLMQLAQSAPGTFQHSVQVANLAEGAAKEIGANPLLARTGALYHDIGKMNSPFYFAENLSGTFNPHNDCSTEQSVEIIKNHVSDGVAVARRYKLPSSVVDIVESHHGQSLIFFFFDKACRESDQVEQSLFRYQGPKPVSREASICMMADAVEAASRSLSSYEKEPLEKLVDKIIATQLADGQLSCSELTFEEVGRIGDLFKSKLNTIYHGRIAYPVRGE